MLRLFWFRSKLTSEQDVDSSPVIYEPLEEELVCAAILLTCLLSERNIYRAGGHDDHSSRTATILKFILNINHLYLTKHSAKCENLLSCCCTGIIFWISAAATMTRTSDFVMRLLQTLCVNMRSSSTSAWSRSEPSGTSTERRWSENWQT